MADVFFGGLEGFDSIFQQFRFSIIRLLNRRKLPVRFVEILGLERRAKTLSLYVSIHPQTALATEKLWPFLAMRATIRMEANQK
jgi:hypothetical protein